MYTVLFSGIVKRNEKIGYIFYSSFFTDLQKIPSGEIASRTNAIPAIIFIFTEDLLL